MIYACGLRRSVLLNIDSKRGEFYILNSKGNNDRVIPISISMKTIETLSNKLQGIQAKGIVI